MLEGDDVVGSARWNAVQRRDPAVDGSFVYAVRTTKIYCRPVCKARLARRANISFYPTAQDAEKAGYRACKRCRPEVAGPMPEERAVRRIRSVVERELAGSTKADKSEDKKAIAPNTHSLARRARVSKWHFHRTFKKVTGLTPAQYKNYEEITRSGASSSETASCDGVAWSRDAEPFVDIFHDHFDANLVRWDGLINTDWPHDLNDPALLGETSHDSAMQSFVMWMSSFGFSINSHLSASNSSDKTTAGTEEGDFS
ncbi:putative HTH araC/xylS-type domain-containing protein [Seiridium cardinale]|uniref:HTH araC/xylS-type domain-containing protein n=1 Tax=Seiridium cardinale TaxID=138064 RepID=A0ABR2XL76_9PEZI